MTLGEKIRELRRGRRLTQEQLAEALDVSPQAVSKWETGVSSPDVELLPRLAMTFQTSMDNLFDFDRKRVDAEVRALVLESLPLRQNDMAQAEAFYRKALERYPNNETLLDCLLITIPKERSAEKLAICERLLDFTEDDEIRCSALCTMALTYHALGEDAMAEHYWDQLPGLYFLKCEIAAAIRSGSAQREEIEKTERVCFGTLLSMLSFRKRAAKDGNEAECYERLSDDLLSLLRKYPGHSETAERLQTRLDDGTLLEYYQCYK